MTVVRGGEQHTDGREHMRQSFHGGNMKTWNVYWSPEGRKIAVVDAKTARAACRKAPMPYRRYLGELYAEVTVVRGGEQHTDGAL